MSAIRATLGWAGMGLLMPEMSGINGRFDHLSEAQLINGCTTLRKAFAMNDLHGAAKALIP
jgi:hypothetical protein